MEQIKIAALDHYQGDDFDELTIRFREASSHPTYASVADDENNIFLLRDAETQEIVGATILYAKDWFHKLAEAFQSMDLDNPEVHLFLQQKLQALANENEAQEREPDAAPLA